MERFLLIIALITLTIGVVLSLPTTPALFTWRWGLKSTGAVSAWGITEGSNDITVAVINAGVDRDSEAFDLWTNKDEKPNDGKDNDGNGYVDDVHGWDYVNNNSGNSPRELHFHGTFISGIVAGKRNKKYGLGGVAPKVNIMDLRLINARGGFPARVNPWRKFANAIKYATDNGADVINISLSMPPWPPKFVKEAVKGAVKNGVVIVVSAGNERAYMSRDLPSFKAWDETVCVGSVSRDGGPSIFTNYGPAVDIYAPGRHILSYGLDGSWSVSSGTSFSAPHVVGAVALIKSLRPQISVKRVKEILQKTGNFVKGVPQKKLNVYRALKVVKG